MASLSANDRGALRFPTPYQNCGAKKINAAEHLPSHGDLKSNPLSTIVDPTPDPRPILMSQGQVPSLILIFDGINEIPRSMAELIISAIDELARRYPFISVLATDRLVRRPIDLDRWKLTTVLPLTANVVRDALAIARRSQDRPMNISLLDRPFFLDKALTTDIVADTEADTIAAYFGQSVGIESDSLKGLADAAYSAYRLFEGRIMPQEWLEANISMDVIEQLKAADALRTHRMQAWFTHHLLHDFLAANFLMSQQDQWDARGFDIVTLRAASFDALRLTVEQLSDRRDGDALVRDVYDWNYYGAAYSLVEGFVSEETRTVILAMLADKKWDLVWATVEQVTDALRFDGSEMARKLLNLNDRFELFERVRAVPSTESWFINWVELFSTPDGQRATLEMVQQLRQRDSIMSWTLANVLRRCRIDQAVLDALVETSADRSEVVRWRAVHVLGAHPSNMAFNAVEARIADPDAWVRYGATRSIVEMAARTNDRAMRTSIFTVLVNLAQGGRLGDSGLRELSRALDIRPQPEDWPLVVSPLIQQLIGLSETIVEQDRWGQLMASIVSASDA